MNIITPFQEKQITGLPKACFQVSAGCIGIIHLYGVLHLKLVTISHHHHSVIVNIFQKFLCPPVTTRILAHSQFTTFPVIVVTIIDGCGGAISSMTVPIIVPRMISFLSPLVYLITGKRLNFSSPLITTEQGGISQSSWHSWPSLVISYQLYTTQTSCCWCLQFSFHFITNCLAVSHQAVPWLVHHCTLVLHFVLANSGKNKKSIQSFQDEWTKKQESTCWQQW